VLDSLPIQIFHTTPENLGNDTSFCAGGTLVLDAGSGYQSYSWSTGAGSQQITVSASGTYWVNALNPGSPCISTDTINISVLPTPVVNIGPDVSICQDSLYAFNAGNGFSSYHWQDGSSNSVFIAGQAGTYWVTVTGQNGCAGSDTARILSVQPNPADFLQPTAEVCSKGQQPIQVNAIGTWSAYLWSDGSTGPSTIIPIPGQYWLAVATSAGCTAVDTIIVSGKTCPFGIFFPNAFTPNNDGNNDVYRPKVYLLIDKFYMAIYNRWGAKVFETTDPNNGWDGRFNGQPQPSGAFVWYASYHVQGSSGGDVLEKGTLMLIR
jgi:gliding motility-associated-like protein